MTASTTIYLLAIVDRVNFMGGNRPTDYSLLSPVQNNANRTTIEFLIETYYDRNVLPKSELKVARENSSALALALAHEKVTSARACRSILGSRARSRFRSLKFNFFFYILLNKSV